MDDQDQAHLFFYYNQVLGLSGSLAGSISLDVVTLQLAEPVPETNEQKQYDGEFAYQAICAYRKPSRGSLSARVQLKTQGMGRVDIERLTAAFRVFDDYWMRRIPHRIFSAQLCDQD